MADALEPTPVNEIADATLAPPAAASPREAYSQAMERYDGAILADILAALGINDLPRGRRSMIAAIVDELDHSRSVERLLQRLPEESHVALTLMAVTESTTWSARGMAQALSCLAVDPLAAIDPLLEHGLVAIEHDAYVRDARNVLRPAIPIGARLIAHPSALASVRVRRPEGERPPTVEHVRQVRETDGLEIILRVAAVWQRVNESPLRQTVQGSVYKRDRERIEDDPVLAGPIADAFEPLPDLPALCVTLARDVGLLESEPGSEKVTAARPEFWSENAIHLPRMIALRWLSLRTWHEQGGMQREGAVYELALPYTRPAILLWLATLNENEWVATDDLAAFLRERNPDWDLPSFLGEAPAPTAPPTSRSKSTRARSKSTPAPTADDKSTLEAILLGPAYQLGLVRAAEEDPGGRRVVQLSPSGRYLLALGPPPPSRPIYEHFLFVQPSFEVIAYRQGLTPGLIGHFSRFALWSQLGAALALKLTPDSVYRGLEGGMTPRDMLDLLSRHSSRPLPPGVAESLRTWADRRERVTYHAAATLVEFTSPADLELALATWPPKNVPPPVRVSDRLLLVEDESTIPYERFRKTGTRDYRRPIDVCVDVEPDGVTLSLDLTRSDLLADAELARFALELPPDPSASATTTPRRRFVVTAESLRRGEQLGVTPAMLFEWFVRRAHGPTPPAIRLILAAQAGKIGPLTTSRPVLIHAPSAEILDGIAQHPDTRDYLSERLGPATAAVPETFLTPLKRALEKLGITLRDDSK